jgi:hypothetical protein
MSGGFLHGHSERGVRKNGLETEIASAIFLQQEIGNAAGCTKLAFEEAKIVS